MEIQVPKTHYSFDEYVDWRRWHSYYYQIKEAIDSGCQDFLIIGVGDGIIPLILTQYGKNVDTFDYDKELNPTYCGNLKNIREIVNKNYECIICCQVLEHLEYKFFEDVISQLEKICNNRLIISLPVKKTELSIYMDLPKSRFIKKIICVIPKFWIKDFPFDGQHFWEVGVGRYPKKRIRKDIEKYFTIKKEYHVPGYTYHWFIIGDV